MYTALSSNSKCSANTAVSKTIDCAYELVLYGTHYSGSHFQLDMVLGSSSDIVAEFRFGLKTNGIHVHVFKVLWLEVSLILLMEMPCVLLCNLLLIKLSLWTETILQSQWEASDERDDEILPFKIAYLKRLWCNWLTGKMKLLARIPETNC